MKEKIISLIMFLAAGVALIGISFFVVMLLAVVWVIENV